MLGLPRRQRPRWLEIIGHRKEQISKCRHAGRLFLLFGFCVAAYIYNGRRSENLYEADKSGSSRHLLASSNDSHSGVVEWERCDFELTHLPGGWIVSHFLCILIIFVALAIICDDFFVPSLEAISEKLKLSEDVAGATFMAAGSSAPELFTSVAGVAVQTDVGVGTIVGSAVFNILIIIALTAALAGKVLHLDWRPLIRDSLFYGMSIACFIIFSWDGYFQIWEAVLLLILYIIYIIIMIVNPKLMDWMATWRCICIKKATVLPESTDQEKAEATDQATDETQVETKKEEPRKPSMAGGHARRLSIISAINRSNPDLHGPDKIFHHYKRGSLVGALTNHTSSPPRTPPRSPEPTRKGSGPHCHENSGFTESKANSNHTKKNTAEGIPNGHVKIKDETNCRSGPDEAASGRKLSHQHSATADMVIPEASSEEETQAKSEDIPEEVEEEEEDKVIECCCKCCPAIRTYPPEREKTTCWGTFLFILKWVIFIVSFPFVVLFSWTIPDCSRPEYRKWFMVSFLVSVLWIAVLSFGMVTLVGRAGCILGVGHYIMGLIVVAIGTSIPDALSSILVARDGFGDMAVSNAIGSNVFDINLGLGLPFVIRIAIDAGKPIRLLSEEDLPRFLSGELLITPHAKFGFVLLLILIITVCVFAAVRFRLNKIIGISFVCLYVVVVIYAVIQEFVCNELC